MQRDADFAYFDLVPMKYNNWSEYRTGVQKALFEPNRSIKLRLNDDLGVHQRGSLAWATVTFGGRSCEQAGRCSALDGRWTMVLERRAQGWIVVPRARLRAIGRFHEDARRTRKGKVKTQTLKAKAAALKSCPKRFVSAPSVLWRAGLG